VPFHVGGMCKGSGMIAPNMATMLCFVTTDAAVPPERLQIVLRGAAERTFNRITVDGDSSTNDCIIVLAGGASGARVGEDGAGWMSSPPRWRPCWPTWRRRPCGTAKEPPAHRGARYRAPTQRDAELAARAVAESQLVKCAVYGGDPNWGRILCAVGYSGAEARLESTTIRLGDICVLENGTPTGLDASMAVHGERVLVRVELGLGAGTATLLSCDLTEEYVRINAEYHT